MEFYLTVGVWELFRLQTSRKLLANSSTQTASDHSGLGGSVDYVMGRLLLPRVDLLTGVGRIL